MVFQACEKIIKAGVSTYEIDALAEKVMLENGCTCPCKGYCGYPSAICVSVNDTLIHGIPSEKIILHDGDIVSLDVVANYQGYNADATRTYAVGTINGRSKRLLEVTEEAFFEALKVTCIGGHVGDISAAIQKYVESHGYNVVREFTGHGIGKSMHEDPSIPNYGKTGSGAIIQEGYALAIEPMVLEGKKDARILKDGWTVKSKDGKLTCHYENTVIITSNGLDIITMSDEEKEKRNNYVKK